MKLALLIQETLTGRVRGRCSRLTGKVVMQVEVAVYARPAMPHSSWYEQRRYWRDATYADLHITATFTAGSASKPA